MEATQQERCSYLNDGYGLASWLLTRDHKRIAVIYLAGVTFFFALGALFAGLVRLELLTPAGDLMEAETYNKAFTLHGVMMVFFFLIPAIPATLGNFLVPIMIGALPLSGGGANTVDGPAIAAQGLAGYRGFDGFLDEIAIYPTALSATTVATHYSTGRNNPAGYAATITGDSPFKKIFSAGQGHQRREPDPFAP